MPEMLIGGEWRQAAAHEELEVVNPATEAVIGTAPDASVAQVHDAIQSQRARDILARVEDLLAPNWSHAVS